MKPLWSVTEETFNPVRLHHNETVFTQGNGFFCTRGALEEFYPGEQRTTFVHGVFDDAPIVFTELANFPDWLEMEIVLDGEPFDLSQGQILDFNRSLNLRNGLLSRRVQWQSPQGRITQLEFARFISLANEHIACLQVVITPENYSGEIKIRSGLNGCADNLQYKHWSWLGQGASSNQCWLHLVTSATQIEMGMAARMRLSAAGHIDREAWNVNGHPTLAYSVQCLAGEPIHIEKVISLFTQREVSQPTEAAQEELSRLPAECFAWGQLWSEHEARWEEEWQRCDVIIEGDDEAQLALRFSIYHLLIAAPRHDEHVNIGAKTLSGFGYRGHVFWDTEIFMLPFFTFTRPEIARNLLSYRFHNLPGAREKAAENGFRGAQYPWESAGDGHEVTPTWIPDPKDRKAIIRIWTGDIEIHISSDIAYAVWQYWVASKERGFLVQRGAEMILDTARFWASRLEWNEQKHQFELTDVIGPDEYHEHVDNNAYTNYLVRWHLETAVRLGRWLKQEEFAVAEELFDKLNISETTFTQWEGMANSIYCPKEEATGLIEQFDGYFRRQDIDLASLEPRSVSVQKLFGIEGTNETQVIKQPDVLMLLYMLADQFDERTAAANYDYYTPRTDLTYGSSLGPSIQAIMAARLGRQEEAYENFMRAAQADLEDVRGNAADGIHGASAGGLWQAVVFGFAGLRVRSDGWNLEPALPAHWKRLAFKFMWHGQEVSVDLKGKEAEVKDD